MFAVVNCMDFLSDTEDGQCLELSDLVNVFRLAERSTALLRAVYFLRGAPARYPWVSLIEVESLSDQRNYEAGL